MRPVFCGNFDYETRQSDLERLFSKHGRVDRVDMKSGTSKGNRALFGLPQLLCKCKITFHVKETILPAHQHLTFTYGILHYLHAHPCFCPRLVHSCHLPSMIIEEHATTGSFAFVYFDDEHDADDAIRGLDGIPFGYSRRKLSVEWARGDRGPRHHEGSRSAANTRPTKTLFVINFDPINTRVRDIERHFEPYGHVVNVRIRRNFAFVQFETQDDATNALEHTNMSKILDRVVSVEYALRDDDDRGARRDSPRRRHGDSPYDRSVSPARYRNRPSPDYGRRPSPDYGRARSPARSPAYDGYDGPKGAYDRNHSPEPARYRSRSPVRRSRT